MSVCRLALAVVLSLWLPPLTAEGPGQVADQQPDIKAENFRPSGPNATMAHGADSGDNSPGNSITLPDMGKTQVRFVSFLPPEKTGMTTGGPGDVTILINRNYPLFVQYSTLIHESVHARDRHLGITPRLSIAQREARALLVELSPANVLATAALAALTEGPQMQHRVATFFQDVLAHYKRFSALAAMQQPKHPNQDAVPSPMPGSLPLLQTATHNVPGWAPR